MPAGAGLLKKTHTHNTVDLLLLHTAPLLSSLLRRTLQLSHSHSSATHTAIHDHRTQASARLQSGEAAVLLPSPASPCTRTCIAGPSLLASSHRELGRAREG